MKKLLALSLVLVMLVTCSVATVFAADEINVTIDGVTQNYDVMPVIIDGRTLVPLRGIFEALGATVEWDGETSTVTGTKGDTVIKLQIGKKAATVGKKVVALDVAGQIVEGRTMVPARFVAESLGCGVEWNADTRTVIILSTGPVEKPTDADDPNLPAGAKVLLEMKNFTDDGKFSFAKANSSYSINDGVLTVDVKLLPEKDSSVTLSAKQSIAGKIADGDVCMLTFKAKLNSGGENGVGYIKAMIQGGEESNYAKSLFVRTSFGSEWSDCYMPFVGKVSAILSAFRFGGMVQSIDIKDIKLLNYGTAVDIATLPSTLIDEKGVIGYGVGTTTSTTTPTTPAAPTIPTPSAPVENVVDATLPAGGTEVAVPDTFINNAKFNFAKANSTYSVENGVLTLDITSMPEKDTSITLTLKDDFTGKFKDDDVCILTFKARLVSGGENGVGYIKPFVQAGEAGGWAKALFDRTNVTSEWTTCYLPFVGKANIMTIGIRFGGMVQKLEFKDAKVINYGSAVKIEELPSTIIK